MYLHDRAPLKISGALRIKSLAAKRNLPLTAKRSDIQWLIGITWLSRDIIRRGSDEVKRV
jgi:hypothetical protein